jgi:hypothetical protein
VGDEGEDQVGMLYVSLHRYIVVEGWAAVHPFLRTVLLLLPVACGCLLEGCA